MDENEVRELMAKNELRITKVGEPTNWSYGPLQVALEVMRYARVSGDDDIRHPAKKVIADYFKTLEKKDERP